MIDEEGLINLFRHYLESKNQIPVKDYEKEIYGDTLMDNLYESLKTADERSGMNIIFNPIRMGKTEYLNTMDNKIAPRYDSMTRKYFNENDVIDVEIINDR